MTSEQEKKIAYIKSVLPQYEDAKRLEHTMGVYRECEWFAGIFDLSDEDRYSVCVAGLLHDITKRMSDEESIEYCRDRGIMLPEDLTSVFHQYTGAPFAREVFGGRIVNDAVYSAILCHTTGKAEMSLIDKILFVSDFTEAGRKYRSCVETREYLHRESEKINKNDKTAMTRLLDDVTRNIIGFTMTYLIEKGRKMDASMTLAWNSLV